MINTTIQIAWRNIWRNPRRTLAILCAVVIGVWSMVMIGSLMRGVARQMVDNGIATLTGHIQIRHPAYRSDPVIENSLDDPARISNLLDDTLPPGAHWTPRIRVPGVASNARHSEGITLVGIDPQKETPVSFIAGSVIQGDYLLPGDTQGILVGQALLEKFETTLGRKLVIMSQDQTGEIASRAFRIRGVFKAEMEATEKQYLFITRAAAHKLLHTGEQVSEVSILLPKNHPAAPLAEALQAKLPPESFSIQTWKELLPMVAAVLQIYDYFIFVWFVVIFIAMGFGIVNTLLMAVFERIREYGLLKALGMRPGRIVRQVLTESALLLIMGAGIGTGLGLAGVAMLKRGGIDLSAFASGLEFAGMSRIIYPVLDLGDLAAANLVVIVLGLLVSLYPAIKAARITPAEAMART
jgi:putative ABC transport system permease protein